MERKNDIQFRSKEDLSDKAKRSRASDREIKSHFNSGFRIASISVDTLFLFKNGIA